MADEIEEAAQRLLAFLPEETRSFVEGDEQLVGMTQLMTENAKRCGVKVSDALWHDGAQDEEWPYIWKVDGEPVEYCAYVNGTWSAHIASIGVRPVYADTFPEMFDRLLEVIQEMRGNDSAGEL